MIRLAHAVAAIGLAAPTAAVAVETSGTVFGDRLSRLPEMQRYAVLRRAVIDGGQSCRRVAAAARQSPYKRFDMWAVRCFPKSDYGVFIAFDSTVQVRPCGDLPKLKMPICRLPPGTR